MIDNPTPIVNVGIIGCGEVTQVVHIPTLGHLSDLFRITYLCDISKAALQFCSQKVNNHVPKTTTDPAVLCASTEVDVVLVVNSDEYHVSHAILALEAGKFVFVEKPMALTQRDVETLIKAEQNAPGKVMVGYMRRYAAAFTDALKEIGGLEKITYARVRDIIGPNSTFVSQSATFPKRFDDFTPEDSQDKASRAAEISEQALRQECNVPVTPESARMWRVLGGLGSHDLSVMREALGVPTKVLGSHLNFPMWSVLFEYPGFAVVYESGIDNIPRFDAHLEIYSSSKVIRVQYDTPYIKGLPVTMHIVENVDGAYHETTIRKTYEDPYTLERKNYTN
ncbi:hypothetical protein H2204_015564 [Knufia peltigerae]|uniref:Gfo/Idh/MocA-like oxidoreductase N-terminal domain-containing protein n=1 Tax=Knufia peltigerae TaxID=1002370 RepID=A0AA39CIC1_9EURO|nr:hypothetical protein H2204_015564 [Knufia peltigerae]